ncbi:MAG TPA: cytochrome c-type biogenesis protein [Xanthobacteraceae bacterium]|nr:cytochrome c-type biogenesis protein [Xanthobacteraceae bacterium]
MQWLRISVLMLALAGSAWAVQPDEILPDPALEARARALSRELRCMVCQNQSIDDSDAPLARDLRLIVRERLKAGDTDDQILELLTSRYGEFVLLRPRFSWHNALLWFAPLIVLALGVAGLVLALRHRRSATPDVTPLSPEEERRLREVINR